MAVNFYTAINAESFVKDGGTSTEYLMADGSTTTFAGITGSGTTNYLPKFTSSSVIGDSIINEVSSEIGIGVAAPKAKLHVDGGIKVGDDDDSPSFDKLGTIRFRTVGGTISRSYLEVCMNNGIGPNAETQYQWVEIVSTTSNSI